MPLPICPTILLAVASIALLSGRWTHEQIRWICAAGYFVALLGAMVALALTPIKSAEFVEVRQNPAAFRNDGLAACEQWIVLSYGLMVGIASCDTIKRGDEIAGTYGWWLFVVSGLLLISSANDFLSLGLSFEVLNLALMALGRLTKPVDRLDSADSQLANRSAVATNSTMQFDWLASAWMWIGIGLLAFTAASTEFGPLALVLADSYDPLMGDAPVGTPSKLMLLATGLISISLLTRVGLVPVHLGFAQHTHKPTERSSGYLLLARQLAGAIALTRVFGCVFVALGPALNVLSATLLLATCSVVVLLAIRGFSPGVRSIPYWVVSLTMLQSVWLVIGPMIAAMELEHTGVNWGAFKGQNETLALVVFNQLVSLLASAGLISTLAHLKRPDRDIEFLEDVKGLGRRSMLASFALVVGLAGLIGCPLTAAFWARWTLLLAGHNIHSKAHSAIYIPYEGVRVVMLAAGFATMAGIVVVVRLSREMFLESPLSRSTATGGRGVLVVGMFAGIASLFLGFCPESVLVPLGVIQHPRIMAPEDQQRGSGSNPVGSRRRTRGTVARSVTGS